MKPIQLTREQVAGLRPTELQSYDEWFQEIGVKPVDLETIPHRKLTHLEAAQLLGAFWEAEQHFGSTPEPIGEVPAGSGAGPPTKAPVR